MKSFRVVVKGRLLGTVETRNMLEFETNDVTTDSAVYADTGANYVTPLLMTFLQDLVGGWSAYSLQYYRWVTDHWEDKAVVPYVLDGTASSDITSYQTAALMIGETGYPRVLGRKFFAGLCESSTVAGALSSFALARFAAGLAVWVAPFFVQNMSAECWPGVVDKDGAFHRFVGGTVGNILSTMRRRKPGYGI